MRLFLAIEVDDAVRRVAGEAMTRARDALGPAAAAFRWTPVENLHITLHFLGSVADDRLPVVRAALGAALDVAPFDATTGAIGTFPHRGPARTVWLAVDRGADSMRRLYDALGPRVLAAGVPVESRPFTPHLTLARVRDRDRRLTRDVARQLAGIEPPSSATWHVARVVLMQSDLSGPRPRYTTVQTIACKGGG